MSNEEFINCIIALQRKEMALQPIYEAYYKKMCDTARGYVRNKADAEDIAMNVLLKLCNYNGDPHEIINHIGLLVRMVQNESINYKNKLNRMSHKGAESLATRDRDRVRMLYYDILDVLDDREKDIFIKHVIWGLSLKRVAKVDGVPYITVKRVYKRIKIKVLKLYWE